jgi:O-6-methylguanine DNA methyltransferase
MIATHTESFPMLGPVTLAASPDGLCLLTLQEPDAARAYLTRRYPGAELRDDPAPLQEALRQLEEYLAGSRSAFTLPLAPGGTEFQRAVWNTVAAIPFGERRSYAWIAAEVGRPRAVRAVGAAVGANPLAIVVPCHRVVGADGKLTGYAYGLPLKEKLLRREAAAEGEVAPG